MSTEKSTIYSQDGGGIMPLRPSDLVFNKTPDGIVSCGYMVKNAMLNSTLNHQFQSGGGKTKLIYGNDAKLNVNKSKIMEDLVVPSSLYYCRPIYKHKVFNCTKGECDNVAKKGKNKGKGKEDEYEDDQEYHDNNVIDESLYDKLLSLVSPGKRMRYDNKTRKSTSGDLNGKQGKTQKIARDDARAAGEIVKMKNNNNNTKNANTNKNKRTRKVKIIMP
jgi:hypothetical protein